MMKRIRNKLINGLMGMSAGLFVGAPLIDGSEQSGPVLKAAVAFVSPKDSASSAGSAGRAVTGVLSRTNEALEAFMSAVRRSSHPKALETAFRSYFAHKATHPHEVTKPYLYFVDYGLPSTQPRGYVFDMQALTVVDGPFMVAHGRGSAETREGIPVRFSNASGSNATSLGLYRAAGTYAFSGKSAGRHYRSVGLRLQGESRGFNDNALARGVVAHGAPYVTSAKAGRSEGCPAMVPARAERLLPKLANGGMVFLFAPNEEWMSRDPWTVAATE
jgi:hypothetical protein